MIFSADQILLGGSIPRVWVIPASEYPDPNPKPVHLLHTAAEYNQANVGVYAAVVLGGTNRRRDSVRLEYSTRQGLVRKRDRFSAASKVLMVRGLHCNCITGTKGISFKDG